MRIKETSSTVGTLVPVDIAQIDAMIATAWDFVTTSHEDASATIKQIISSSGALGYREGALQALLLDARHEGGQDHYKEALVKANEAHSQALELNNTDILVRTWRVLGFLYTQMGRYDDALTHLLNAIKHINETGITVMEGQYSIEVYLYNNVAFVYHNLGKTTEALRFFLNAYDIAKPVRGTMLATTLNNIAEMHLVLGDAQMALRYNHMALEEITSQDLGAADQHQCYNTFGLIYTKMSLFTKALENFRQAISIAAKSGSKTMQITSALDLSKLYLMMDNSAMALEVVNTALPLAQEIQANVHLRDIHQLLSQIYERMGNFRYALDHYKTHQSLSQEIFATETKQRLSYYEAEFRAQQAMKDAEIYRLTNIELRQNSKALEESNRNITIISQIGQKLTSTLNIEDILTTLYDNVNELVDANVFGIALYDKPSQTIEYKLMLEEGTRVPLNKLKLGERNSYAEQCILQSAAVMDNDVPHSAAHMEGSNYENRVHSLIYCPLQFAGNIIGVMTVQSYKPQAYSQQHLNMLIALASYVAIALNNSQKSEELRQTAIELEQLSKQDPLTGLYNRRHIIEKMDDERLRYLRYSTDFSLILLDIDYFKRVNDSYGHDCGDHVLVEVAGKMREQLRQQDCLARWGGEEFLIMMPETDTDGAKVLAERLRVSIQDMALDYNGITLHVTVTLGVCQFVGELSIDEIIMRADRALYRGKKRGRNCVVVYDA